MTARSRRLLLTTHHLKDFAGSELVMLDLAKEMRAIGYDVTIGTFIFEDPLRQKVLEEEIEIINLLESPLPRRDFDLIWAQHSPVLYHCLFNLGARADTVIFSSLSPYEPLEGPVLFANELSLCLANSQETRDRLLELGVESSHTRVFPNSVPPAVFGRYERQDVRSLRRIAIISNHLPPEVLAAAEGLTAAGLSVDIFGLLHRVELITPDLLLEYDALITIGRTVQFGLALGLPVYCYDHFGGPGWLDTANFEQAEYYNFSGRCTRRKLDAEALCAEVISGYLDAVARRDDLQRIAKERYCLRANIERVLEQVQAGAPFDWGRLERYKALSLHGDYYRREMNHRLVAQRENERHLATIEQLSAVVASMEADLAKQREAFLSKEAERVIVQESLDQTVKDLHRVLNSISWRLTRPLRDIRRAMTHNR